MALLRQIAKQRPNPHDFSFDIILKFIFFQAIESTKAALSNMPPKPHCDYPEAFIPKRLEDFFFCDDVFHSSNIEIFFATNSRIVINSCIRGIFFLYRL